MFYIVQWDSAVSLFSKFVWCSLALSYARASGKGIFIIFYALNKFQKIGANKTRGLTSGLIRTKREKEFWQEEETANSPNYRCLPVHNSSQEKHCQEHSQENKSTLTQQ